MAATAHHTSDDAQLLADPRVHEELQRLTALLRLPVSDDDSAQERLTVRLPLPSPSQQSCIILLTLTHV